MRRLEKKMRTEREIARAGVKMIKGCKEKKVARQSNRENRAMNYSVVILSDSTL